MTLRSLLLAGACALALAPSVRAASVETDNFVVHAPNAEMARTFGQWAEKYRREKAVEWLGRPMEPWAEKCPLRVKITMGQTGGATTFTFGVEGRRGYVRSQEMEIFGGVDQLLYSVLPHEVTHTVLAHHFGRAVPRWADEGGSVLSENDDERFNHDVRCREVLNQGRGIPLKHLFEMEKYPRDMIVLYAQGYSITQYLVDRGGRAKFLEFLAVGMRSGQRNWDEAVQQFYGQDSVDQLQVEWIAALRTPPQRVAARTKAPAAGGRPAPGAEATVASRGVETRSSGVRGEVMLEPAVMARGAAPAGGENRTFASTAAKESPAANPATASATPRPGRFLGLLPPEPAGR